VRYAVSGVTQPVLCVLLGLSLVAAACESPPEVEAEEPLERVPAGMVSSEDEAFQVHIQGGTRAPEPITARSLPSHLNPEELDGISLPAGVYEASPADAELPEPATIILDVAGLMSGARSFDGTPFLFLARRDARGRWVPLDDQYVSRIDEGWRLTAETDRLGLISLFDGGSGLLLIPSLITAAQGEPWVPTVVHYELDGTPDPFPVESSPPIVGDGESEILETVSLAEATDLDGARSPPTETLSFHAELLQSEDEPEHRAVVCTAGEGAERFAVVVRALRFPEMDARVASLLAGPLPPIDLELEGRAICAPPRPARARLAEGSVDAILSAMPPTPESVPYDWSYRYEDLDPENTLDLGSHFAEMRLYQRYPDRTPDARIWYRGILFRNVRAAAAYFFAFEEVSGWEEELFPETGLLGDARFGSSENHDEDVTLWMLIGNLVLIVGASERHYSLHEIVGRAFQAEARTLSVMR